MTALLSRFMANFQSAALGALIGLGLLMVVDWLLSMWCLHRRPVSLQVTKTMVIAPERFTFTLSAPSGWSDLRIVVRRMGMTERDGEFVTLARNDDSVTVASSPGGSHAADYVRFRTETSVIGLIAARRWTTHTTPMLFRMVTPIEEDAAITSVDDQSRLRAYVPGDRMASVSWGATARTGSLHVRASAPDLDEVTLVVDMGATLEYEDGIMVGEAVAGRAFHVGREILRSGRPLRVITNSRPPELFQHTRKLAFLNPRCPRLKGLDYSPEGRHHINGKPAWVVTSRDVYDEAALIQELARMELGPPIMTPAGPHVAIRRTASSVVPR